MATKLPIALETTSQEILSKLTSGIGGGIIKSIQWGRCDFSYGEIKIVYISSVDSSRSIVLLNGGTFNDSFSSDGNHYYNANVYIYDFHNTGFSIGSASAFGGTTEISWQVIEFT